MSTALQQTVVISGQLITLEEVIKKYPEVTLPPAAFKIMNFLTSAKKPMTRKEIECEVKICRPYCLRLLRELIEKNLVYRWRVKGTNIRVYLLTETGVNLLKRVEEEIK